MGELTTFRCTTITAGLCRLAIHARLLTLARLSQFLCEWLLTVLPLCSSSIWTPTLTTLGASPGWVAITSILMCIHLSTPVPPETKLPLLLTLAQESITVRNIVMNSKKQSRSHGFNKCPYCPKKK